MCELAEGSTLARRVRAIWGSSSFCSCWCKILDALMADDVKSSQKLLSPMYMYHNIREIVTDVALRMMSTV